MISKYTVGSKIHQALERIRRSNVTAQDLRKEINYTESILRLEEFIVAPLISDGFVVRTRGHSIYPVLAITPSGEERYLSLGLSKKRRLKVERIDRFVGTYDGNELKPFIGRPGAMDHEKCPSLMANGPVYRRVR